MRARTNRNTYKHKVTLKALHLCLKCTYETSELLKHLIKACPPTNWTFRLCVFMAMTLGPCIPSPVNPPALRLQSQYRLPARQYEGNDVLWQVNTSGSRLFAPLYICNIFHMCIVTGRYVCYV